MAKQHPPYRTAIIGVGRIGHSLGNDRLREQPASHSRAVNENPRLSLVAVTDTDPKKLAAFKKDFPAVKLYPGTDALFTAEKPDIVIVAVDTDQHAPVARTVLPFRPRLLVMEKPVAPNPHEAREIARTAAHYEVPVQINHERRFAGDYRLVKDLLSRGKIGELAAVRAHLWSGAPVWDKAAARTGDCSLLHDGTHLIDTLRFLLGKELKKPNIDFIKKKKDGSVSRLQAHEVVTGDV
ncbi:MAG TPA: Gfo/Idh/MocA family oxidoreductase, partial [Spirochaetia bacterium]|nr:Gfo/Idh/MocA family oxidoreductase [Spirochaetia bacterium]